MVDFNDLPPDKQQSFLYGPALKSPPGVQSNFENHSTGNKLALAVIIVCLVISAVCILLRFYSRVVVVRRVRIEDAVGFATAGFFCGVLWVGFRFSQVPGFFVHQWDIHLLDMSKVLYITYIMSNLYCWTLLFAKSAILLEWVHIFVPPGTRNTFYWACVGFGIANFIFYISFIIAVQFSCLPRQKIWDRWLPGVCLDRKKIDAPCAIFNLIFDLIILAFPQKVIWKLKLSTKKKIGVSVIFSFGLLACICAAGRVQSTVSLDFTGDLTYGIGPAYLWAVGECTCVILVFCVVSFPQTFHGSLFLTQFMSSFRTRRLSRTKDSNNTSYTAQNSDKTTPYPLGIYKRVRDGDSGTKIPLKNARPGEEIVTHLEAVQDDNDEHMRILRTIEWRTSECIVRNTPASLPSPEQHPWV
ncbi:hypothetical protein HJFPF1_07193 [Paramyrothecium foliicola]|nr:hypothetical protein HJFPF1_07193 [Paramyrothecium foliicola]